MPSASSRSAAWMPSQVAATLISTRSRPMPAAAYRSISRCALAIVPSTSKDSRASTSVDTRPGMMPRISRPKRTSSRSQTSAAVSSGCAATVSSSSGRYSGLPTAFRISVGLVVASRGA